MRTFRQYEKAYGTVNGKWRMIMVLKQSPIWTTAMLVDYKGPWCKATYVRVKTNSLLPLPSPSAY